MTDKLFSPAGNRTQPVTQSL